MKNIVLGCLLACLSVSSAKALHIKGGWIEYTYLSSNTSANTSTYSMTVYLLVTCNSSIPYPPNSLSQVYLGIFDAYTNSLVKTVTISQSNNSTVSKSSYNPCLSNPPSVCFKIYTFNTTVTLSNNTHGYTLAVQDALRSSGIVNVNNSGTSGITITNGIPGTINGTDYHANSSPSFVFKDTTILCYNSSFEYQFTANDADGDSISYYFDKALNVANTSMQASYNPPSNPPYPAMTYSSGFSGTQPLGGNVSINSATGLISGIAPSTTGEYVLAVYVSEWRNGVKINTLKKELQLYVNNCSLTAASLPSTVLNCKDYAENFQNQSTASNITSYNWTLGVPSSPNNTSTASTVSFTYPDSGTYTVKLVVANNFGCKDSATSIVKIYPGLKVDYAVVGSCYQSPFVFTNLSQTGKSGIVSNVLWDFGVAGSTTDTSSVYSPSYTFSVAGNYAVKLTVQTDKGCTSDLTKTVVVNDKPYLHLPFTDTLICSIDSLPLIAQSTSGVTYSWKPLYNIINPSTSNPIVYPKDTTVYTVVVTEMGCVDSGKITVNVLDFITVRFVSNVDLCLTDTVALMPISYALSYLWSPSVGLSSTTGKHPKASPSVTTTYYVTANLGKCQDASSVTVRVAPYPQVKVGADTSICFGTSAQLHGEVKSVYLDWSPKETLTGVNTLNPVASPLDTTAYMLTVRDTSYCKKPVSDTVIVRVVPKIHLNIGSDTVVVVGQPLQLNGTGVDSSYTFLWSPTNYLNDASLRNPIATIYGSADSVQYIAATTSPEGCVGYDTIVITVFKTKPDIFLPTAFTPNGDGKNDVITPVLVGIKEFKYFSIFNRWGQRLFTTSTKHQGWNGLVQGNVQDPGTYIYIAEGIDYLGKVIQKKGAFVLIR